MNRKMLLDAINAPLEIVGQQPLTAAFFDQPFIMRKNADAPNTAYVFAAKTLGDVADVLLKDRARRYSHRDGSAFAWCVKAYPDRNGTDTQKRNPALDSAWDAYLDSPHGESIHASAFEQAQEWIRREWCSYPGDDQGEWEFAFYGRSGGWLCLTHWPHWRGYDIEKMDEDSVLEMLAQLFSDYENGTPSCDFLESFYRGIVCADADFTRAKASESVSYYYGEARAEWEETRLEGMSEVLARAMEIGARKALGAYGLHVPPADIAEALADVPAAILSKVVQ